MSRVPIAVLPLTPAAVAPYGWMLGKGLATAIGVPRFSNARTDFWQEHVFDSDGGEPEVLWVNYRDRTADIDALEVHRLTEQAVVALGDDIVQVLAQSAADGSPDPASLRAVVVKAGQGICMRPGCWHATRVTGDEATCLMLTRRSTTVDLIGHLHRGTPLAESALAPISARLVFPAAGTPLPGA